MAIPRHDLPPQWGMKPTLLAHSEHDVLFAGFRGLLPEMSRARNVTRNAIGAGLKSPHIFLDAEEGHALWKGQPSMLAGSTGSSIGATAPGAGDAGDCFHTAIMGAAGFKGAPPSLTRPAERATPRTCHGCSWNGEPS